ncbi:uncharacterized protein [Panulirus ornatus]|uniref:uncharacterized protein n=1 Tax=Panulirus ornatus TaxID=150431 RepID=UPI003A8A6911
MSTKALLLSIICCGSLQVLTAEELHKVSSDGVVYAAAPQERGAYSVGGAGGHYNYGYNTGDGIAKVELGQPDGSVVGSYRYFDPNGKQVLRSYIADEKGFRVMGNDLPISPDTPASQIPGSPAFTAAVEGTDKFAIPPPLSFQSSSETQTSSTQLEQQVASNQLQVEQQVPSSQLQGEQQQASSSQLQLQQQLQSQQEEYQRHLQQLEEQRRQLQIQQEKLQALQRELEAQQLKIQQQFQVLQPQPQQYRPVQQFQTPAQPQAHEPQYLQLQNQLTGGLTSPYYYFQHDLNYDFPAGFAYTGLPTLRSPAPSRPQQPGTSYIIGQAR